MALAPPAPPHDAPLAAPLLTISDFSPDNGNCAGGTKVLVCLDGGLPAALLERATLLCAFGAELVAVEVLNASVLRCISPPHASAGRVPLRVAARDATGHTRVLTQPSRLCFTYRGLPARVGAPRKRADESAPSAAAPAEAAGGGGGFGPPPADGDDGDELEPGARTPSMMSEGANRESKARGARARACARSVPRASPAVCCALAL